MRSARSLSPSSTDAIKASLHLTVEDFDTEVVFKIGESIHLQDWATELYGKLFLEWES